MPLNIDCPCGHTVRIPDEMATGRVKCPVCGELLSVERVSPGSESASSAVGSTPNSHSDTASEQSEQRSYNKRDDDGVSTGPAATRNTSILHATGGFLFAGLPTPSFFTESTLTLLPERVRLKSSGLLTTRRVDLRLSEITSAETRQSPAWYLLLPGILLLAQGVGLIFLVAFLFVRHSFLILRCGPATVAVRFKGDDTDACAISDAILQAATKSGE